MGGATTTTTTTLRLFTLLSSSPFSFLHRPPSFLLLRRLSNHRTSLFFSPSYTTSPPKCSHQLHSQPLQSLCDGTLSSFSNSKAYSNHPWPEFLHFLNWVSISGDINANGDSFLKVVNPCLDFARAHPNLIWTLPREDIEVILEDNGSPFLFENASSTMERMNFFRRGRTNDVLGRDKPSTIDLMELLLSYAHLAIGNSENVHNRVETSVRRLFLELSKAKENYVESFATKEYSSTYGQVSRSLETRIDMKKGDWICPRCNFMNFAKNSQCLECKETRPKKFITGGEWECPQCDFYNFSRNVVCLRCDCKKPGSNPFVNPTPSSNLIPNSNVKNSTDKIIADNKIEQTWFTKIRQLEEESGDQNQVFNSGLETNDYEREQTEKSERWFEKVEELNDVNDLPSVVPDEDFPEIMPTRKGENRFVIGKKKDRSLTSPMYKRKAAIEQAGNDNFVPFVPFPPGYFSKDKKQEATELTNSSQQTSSDFEASNDSNLTRNLLDSNSSSERREKERSVETWRMKSLEGSAVKEPDPLDMSEEAKAERWFRRVAQIKDISELSEIPDEDFPSIMPMRKGVNRFVVSKRKTPLERRLTSSQYRRNLPTQKSEPMMGREKDSN